MQTEAYNDIALNIRWLYMETQIYQVSACLLTLSDLPTCPLETLHIYSFSDLPSQCMSLLKLFQIYQVSSDIYQISASPLETLLDLPLSQCMTS